MHQTEADPLSAVQKVTLNVAIESLEFLKQVSTETDTEIVFLTRADLEQFIKREDRTENPAW